MVDTAEIKLGDEYFSVSCQYQNIDITKQKVTGISLCKLVSGADSIQATFNYNSYSGGNDLKMVFKTREEALEAGIQRLEERIKYYRGYYDESEENVHAARRELIKIKNKNQVRREK